ncbi:unnamed protein product [Rotaria magnacalcarata]|uniref:AIG1-type G domain-containing protein n=1 Tax=Rotaria magnacalcarata TaxID=392030 RepID=A0A816NVD7_9BILA|nr:unnamed protein product [Rotaria magnacalcarata]CAF4301506.1 unnamed protein product [Rotaria magnacalcarata]
MTEKPPPYAASSIRARYADGNHINKSREILAKLKADFKSYGKFPMKKVEHKNILLIGRTRTGKSTIQSLLIDPTNVPEELTLRSGTRDPHFQAFHLQEDDVVLNIIDTPGLFEHSNDQMDIRDNETILKTIGFCINMEIAKFHAICFCVSLVAGINAEDINSLKLLAQYLGQETAKNSCVIITRCESISKKQREKLKKELIEDFDFKQIAPFFKLGIYFSGSINRDDLSRGNEETVYHQYSTISDYREELIDLFLKVKDPLPVAQMASGSKQFREHYHAISSNTTAKSSSSDVYGQRLRRYEYN